MTQGILDTCPRNEQFLISHSVFYPFGELSAVSIKFKIVVCKLLVWKNLKFVV